MGLKLKRDVSERYVVLLNNKGEDGLYRHVVGTGVMRSVKVPNPDLEILDMSEAFFTLFRRNGDEAYFIIGKVLRRAAHALYRQFLRINKEKQKSERFLNVVP
jgi:hypothetical protein